MLGEKNLCKAAYFQAAPHHNFGRALKCSKEEAMGILAAVETWYKRDHAAEQKMWRAWLNNIENRLKGLPSTSFGYHEPEDLSNRAPSLQISWDANVLKITGTELAAKLDAGTPRIILGGGRGTTARHDAKRNLRHALHDGSRRRQDHRRRSLRCSHQSR